MLYFCVEFLCCMKLSLLCYFVLYFLPLKFCVIFFYVWNALWYCGISCYIYLLMECALVLRNYVLYFSACIMRSSIVEFCVIFFCVWNVLWYHGISCYIFLRVECALVLWNFMLYFSACGTRSGIVEFHVIFFHILKFLVEIIQLIVVHVCFIFRVVYFVFYFSACGTCSGIVEFCVICFRV